MSKTKLIKQLQLFSKEEMIEMLTEFYQSSKEAKDYLDYFVEPDENKKFDEAKAVIHKVFFEPRKRPKPRISVCEKAIRHFQVYHPSAKMLIELQLFYIESALTRYKGRNVFMWAKYEPSVNRCFNSCLNGIAENKMAAPYTARLKKIVDTTGWQLTDSFYEI